MSQTVLLVVVLMAVGLAAAGLHGSRRWQADTRELRSRLEAAPRPAGARGRVSSDLESLPAPVQRYLGQVLPPGGPRIAAARLRQVGTFDRGGKAVRWVPFTAEQVVTTAPPGFDWDARIRLAPGLTAFVHDAYVAGEGLLRASLAGLVRLAEMRGTPQLAQGELMRFLAEAPWYPTVLLPGQGVEWEPLDASSARATLRDGAAAVSLDFFFGEDGLVETVHSEARPRLVEGETLPTPWRGRFWGYEHRSGILVPTEAEVAWIVEGVLRPYWRGRVVELEYSAV